MPDPEIPQEQQERITALMTLLGATGVSNVELRYSDDQPPTVWMAIGTWKMPNGEHQEAHGGLVPLRALYRLAEDTIDGGECPACGRGTALSDRFDLGAMPRETDVCWWKYNAGLGCYQRGCDGKHAGTKR